MGRWSPRPSSGSASEHGRTTTCTNNLDKAVAECLAALSFDDMEAAAWLLQSPQLEEIHEALRKLLKTQRDGNSLHNVRHMVGVWLRESTAQYATVPEQRLLHNATQSEPPAAALGSISGARKHRTFHSQSLDKEDPERAIVFVTCVPLTRRSAALTLNGSTVTHGLAPLDLTLAEAMHEDLESSVLECFLKARQPASDYRRYRGIIYAHLSTPCSGLPCR